MFNLVEFWDSNCLLADYKGMHERHIIFCLCIKGGESVFKISEIS